MSAARDAGWEFMGHSYEQGPIHNEGDQPAMTIEQGRSAARTQFSMAGRQKLMQDRLSVAAVLECVAFCGEFDAAVGVIIDLAVVDDRTRSIGVEHRLRAMSNDTSIGRGPALEIDHDERERLVRDPPVRVRQVGVGGRHGTPLDERLNDRRLLTVLRSTRVE